MLNAFLERLKSLKVSLMLIMLLCWLLPTVILGAFMGTKLSASLREKTDDAIISDAKQARTLLLSNVSQAVVLAKDATYDGELNAAYLNYSDGTMRYQEYFKSVRSYLDRKYSRERLFQFALFFTLDKPEQINYTSQAYSHSALFIQNAQKQVLEICETLDTGCRFFDFEGQAYLIRNLYDMRLERYGVLVLGLSLDELLGPVALGSMDGMMSYAAVLDTIRWGEWIDTTARDTLEETGESLLYTQSEESADYTLLLQARADKRLAYAQEKTLLSLMRLMILLIVPLCAMVMLYVQRRIVRPIGKLAEASKRIEGGELGFEVTVGGAQELKQLGSAFSNMSLRLKRLIDKSYKEEIALRDARIQALQSRINPHFINNALEDINWQSRINGDETVSKMVETLSVLLNAGLDRSERHLVTLGEELRVAEAYFYFIGLRFGQRLTVEKRIDPDVSPDVLVPRLIIQVLIENAVEHGISLTGGGHILLWIYKKDEQLFIEVDNDGKPLDQKELDRMERLMQEDAPEKGHIGIRNVNQRLRLLFPDEAGLSFGLTQSGQTAANIHLPYTTKEPE